MSATETSERLRPDYRLADGVAVITVTGEIDVPTCGHLREALCAWSLTSTAGTCRFQDGWGARNQSRRVQQESLVLWSPAADCRAGSLTASVPPAGDAGAGAISRNVGNAASETGIGSSKASTR